MARNVEIKVRIENMNAIRDRVAELSGSDFVELRQDDTFFNCARGRLKLRVLSATQGELIFYERANEAGPKESFYVVAKTSTPDELREVLSLSNGQCGRVRKERTLYNIGRTRVHLDRVEGLGEFLELEVVLSENEQAASGIQEAHALMARLGIAQEQLVELAYIDLLMKQVMEDSFNV